MKRTGNIPTKRLWIITIIILISNITSVGALNTPTIDIWYEDAYTFGQHGTPQTWLNFFGNVSDPDGIDTDSLEYELNGAYTHGFNIGPDDRRLANAGDFNIDIDITNSDLISGTNSLMITAADTLGNTITETISFDFTTINSWPLPYTADWNNAAEINDVAQVVDGHWTIQSGGVRPTYLDYDRVIAIGDLDWTDYTVTTPVTIHGLDPDPGAFEHPSVQPGIGIITHWLGHDGFGQPKNGWSQLGALGWITWSSPTNDYIELLAPDRQLGTSAFDVVFGETYIYKMQVETQPSDVSIFRIKIWHEDDPEPPTWAIEELGEDESPRNGSLMLTAHHVDATFGRVIVQTNANSANPTLTVNTTGNGSTSRNIDYPYATGEIVELTATPDAGWVFSEWSGDITSNNNPLDVTLSSDVTITAVFTEEPPELTTNSSGDGSITRSDPGPYTLGQSVDLTAVPNTGWDFINWSGDASGSTNPISVTLTSDITVTAVFTPIIPVLTTNSSGDGSVSRSSNAPYTYGESVDLTAVPDPGWEFSHWTGDASGSTNPKTVTLNGDVAVTAVFTPIVPVLTTGSNGDGSINRSDAGPYTYGESVILTAVPDPGWEFSHWSGDAAGSANPKTVTLNSDVAVTAVFTQIEVELTTSILGNGTVTPSAIGTYHQGQGIILTATPDPGWVFVGWSGDMTTNTNPLPVILNSDLTIQAEFELEPGPAATTYTIFLPVIINAP